MSDIIAERKIAGGNAMKFRMLPVVGFAVLLASLFLGSSCGNGVGNANCPVCGTNQNGGVNLIDVMIVPEHNPNGEPGGPFNIFDISWVDPTNRLFFVTDRIGLDVPIFSTMLPTLRCSRSAATTPLPRLETTPAYAIPAFLRLRRRRATSPDLAAKMPLFVCRADLVPTGTSADGWEASAAPPVPIT